SLIYSQSKIPIRNVSFEGNVSTDTDVMRWTSGLTSGKKISSDEIQNAIKQLWSLRHFSDIDIYKTNPEADFIDIIVKVVEYPSLERLRINGAEEVKKEDIDEEMGFYPGQKIFKQRVDKKLEKVKKLYEEKGFLLAEFNYFIPSETAGKVILELNIIEGDKVRIQEILFSGNENFDDSKLKTQMKKTKEKRWWRKGNFKRDQYEEDKELILVMYRKNGYKDARIVIDSLSYSEDRTGLNLYIIVQEGKKYYFGDVEFTGKQSLDPDRLKSVINFRKGGVYNEEKYEESIGALGKLYYDNGFLYASPQANENIIGDTVNFVINIDERNQVKINKVIITGNTSTKDFVIRREVRAKPGEVFSAEKIEGTIRDLMILNYFYNVYPEMMNATGETVDLIIKVEEKPTGTANMSAGYSELDGMIGSLGAQMTNLFGNGQQFSLNWQFGRIYRSFQISFVEPWFAGKPTLAGFSFFDLKRGGVYYPYDYKSRGISFSLGRRFTWPDRYFRGDMIFSASKNRYWNFKEGYNLSSIFFLNKSSTHYSITTSLSRDSRNNPEFPSKGSTFIFRNQFAGGIFGGSEDFTKHELNINFYFPAFWKFVSSNTVKMGVINKNYAGAYVPPLERFYMGGSAMSIGEPLRGYEDRSVGPGLGGTAMLKYVVDLRFPISMKPTMYGLIFAEAGNTWSEFKYANPLDLKKSVGFGFRMYMPMMGMIGIDFGYGFDYFENGIRKPKLKTHFQFGQSF
ncbi:outer membrane protein assembly factor BamA, partial [candidate division KSB1 bacterium]